MHRLTKNFNKKSLLFRTITRQFSSQTAQTQPNMTLSSENRVLIQEATDHTPEMQTAFHFGDLYKDHLQQGQAQAQPILIWGANLDLYQNEHFDGRREDSFEEINRVDFLEDFLDFAEDQLRESGKIKETTPRSNNLETKITQIFDVTSENEFFKFLENYDSFRLTNNEKARETRRLKELMKNVTSGVISPKEFLQACRRQEDFRDPGDQIQSLLVGLKGELQVKATTEDVLILEKNSGDLYVMGTSYLGGSVRIFLSQHFYINFYE